MKNMKLFLVSVITLFVLLTGCRTALMPEKPEEKYSKIEIKPQISTINMQFDMTVRSLESLLNRQLTGVIYKDSILDDDNLLITAWKKENIKLGFENGIFNYRVPLKLYIKAGWKFERFGISLSDYKEMNAEIALNFKTSVAINKDWSITTITSSQGYEWLSKPVLKLGPVDIPITMIADLIVANNMETINSSIDEGLQSSLDLKANAQEAWVTMQEPMLLDEEYQLWMRLIPKSISAMPISGGKGIIRQTSAIQTVAECFVGPKPSFSINYNLPEITPLKKAADNFELNITSYIPFSYVDSATKAQLAGTSYTFGKRELKINSVDVYGSEKNLIIETNVSGSLNGKLYFEGIPVYRESDSSIVFQDLQFNIKTKNLLVKAAGWIANSGIEKVLAKKMFYPIGSDLRSTFQLLSDNLKYYALGEGFYIKGTLQQLNIGQIILTHDAVLVPVILQGNSMVGLEEYKGK